MMRKNWIFILGMAFLFGSFLYGLKIAFDAGLIPEEGKIFFGLLVALSLLAAAYHLYRRKVIISAEILAGFGGAVLYATFAYASFISTVQWSTNTLFIAMFTASAIFAFLSDRYKLRTLANIAFAGGLFTPLLIRAQEAQVTLLFVYLLILTVAALFLSLRNRWHEIRIITFLGTLLLYGLYYALFSPISWEKPLFYVSSIFLVYMIGTIVSSVILEDSFQGIDLYLGLLNALNFTFWSIFIFSTFSWAYAIPLSITAVSLLIVAIVIHTLNRSAMIPAGIYFFGALLLLSFTTNDIGRTLETPGLRYAVSAGIWLLLIALLYFVAATLAQSSLVYVSLGLFFLLLIYWYAHAWDVEWVTWFGVPYIPFINPGALVWIGLAGLAFTAALSAPKLIQEPDGKILTLQPQTATTLLSLVGHVVLGGLFTIQIQNAWTAYAIELIPQKIAVSASWMLYASTLFLWGMLSKDLLYRIFGSIVVGVTALKVFFYDISDQSTVVKALTLFGIGLLILLIAGINQMWHGKQEKLDSSN